MSLALVLGVGVVCVVVWGAAGQEVGSVGSVGLPHSDYKLLNGCPLPNGKDLLAFNESKSLPGVCHMVTCHEDGHTTYTRCIAEVLPDNCTLSEFNLTLAYPECCPIIICQNETGAVGSTTTSTTTTIKLDTNSTETQSIASNSTNELSTIIPEVSSKTEISNITNAANNTKTEPDENIILEIKSEPATLKRETTIKKELSTSPKPVQDIPIKHILNETGILGPHIIKQMIAKLIENTTSSVTISPVSSNTNVIETVALKNNETLLNIENTKANKTKMETNATGNNITVQMEKVNKSLGDDDNEKDFTVKGIDKEDDEDDDEAEENEDSSQSSEIAEEVETTLSEKISNLNENRRDTDNLRSELIIINFYRNH